MIILRFIGVLNKGWFDNSKKKKKKTNEYRYEKNFLKSSFQI